MVRVAIIIPTYNRGRNGLLEKTLLSVSRQSFGDLVCLVVDDGSTDNTPDVVRSFSQDDSRIVYVRRERTPDQKFGASSASNDGIGLVLGDPRFSDVNYITFLHSDDLLSESSIEDRVRVIENAANCFLVYGKTAVCDETMRLLRIVDGRGILDPKKVVKGLKIKTIAFPYHTLMFRRELLAAVKGYDLNLGFGEDRDIAIRAFNLLEEGGRVGYVPEILVYYRAHDDTVTGTFCKTGETARDLNFADRKNGVSFYDTVFGFVSRVVTRPYSLLPCGVKLALRKRMPFAGTSSFRVDAFISEIEGCNF